MRLSNLAFACFLYAQFTNYDNSYLSFLQTTNYHPDLVNPEHRKALLIWLNQWGCRQFAIKYHEFASSEILAWYAQFNSTFFGQDKNLWELTEAEINSVGPAYKVLSKKRASFRKRKGNTASVSIGPTGAAKILFAIRRNARIPWVILIRSHYGYDSSGASYLTYLYRVKSILKELEDTCNKNRFTLAQLPKQLRRNNSTVPKLIDEYHWVTITNGCSLPTQDIFQKWAQWSKI